MRFVSRSDIRSRFEGRSVAVVGSGPGVLGNAPGLVDGHDVVAVTALCYQCCAQLHRQPRQLPGREL